MWFFTVVLVSEAGLDKKIPAAAAGIVFIITFMVFSRAIFCGFVNLDDPIFVQNNPFIRSFNADFFKFAFSSATLDIWMPLTWFSFAVDYHLWGLNPAGFHLINILLHSANSALVFFIATHLFSAGRDGSTTGAIAGRQLILPLLAALVWGLHPLRVESVAWVTERKDVLNGFFALFALLFYLHYADKGKGRDYGFSLLFFALSLMSKPVSVVLPVIFLLLDYCPLSRHSTKSFAALAKEKIPFLALSAAAALLTIFLFSQRQLLVGFAKLSLFDRSLLSGNALFEYLKLMLYPVGILPFYEMPESIGMEQVVKTLLVAAFFIFVLLSARNKPWLFTGAFCFLLPLLPVLAFFQNNDVAYAARYTYLPSIAPALIVAAGFSAGYDKIRTVAARLQWLPIGAALLVLFFYSALTNRLISVWQNTETLWTRVITLDPSTPKYMDRGVYYMIHNRPLDASRDFSSAIEGLAKRGKKPDNNAFAFRGVAFMDLQQYEKALQDFDAALALKLHPTYYYYRGLTLQALGKNREAELDFKLAGPNPPPIDTF